MNRLTAEDVIRRLSLVPLPVEGGFFRETHRSDLRIPREVLPAAYRDPRPAGTAIYYLLTPATFSALHRLPGVEIFHFYLGDPVEMLQLRPDGSSDVVLIGTDLESGHQPQIIVPPGVWQGCRLVEGGRFALMGTTMAPGFDPDDFELGVRADLIARFPAHAPQITALTHGS